jgi:tetratricopeptide (TPR) repeat protein
MAIKFPWPGSSSVLLLTCLFCLGSCSTLKHNRQAQYIIPANLPLAAELSSTPFFPQTANHCGPASLATILGSYNIDVTPESLTASLYIPQRKGSLQVEMTAATRQYGMLAYPLNPSFADLLTEIAAGHPVLVLQNLRFEWWPKWHYAVVIGYDIENSEMILRSGTTRRWLTTFDTFINTWKRADNWALVIVPAGQMPATATASSYLKTVHALEETGFDDYALEAYRAATTQWPHNPDSWITLGNMAYKHGDPGEAVSALLQASALDPENTVAWNNLAYALHACGCTAQALESLRCARELSPDDPNIRDSEYEITNMTQQPRTTDCPQIRCN